MNEDTILLRSFVDDQSEAAFTALVRRHLALVHATVLRRVGGDLPLAQDVTQAVFISLARKAAALRNHASLAGWLYVSTLHATAEVVRREQRRKQREAHAHFMQLADKSDDPPVDPAVLRPLLDDALVGLKADDREAVVLRFFAQRSFAEIGAALRITEEAARKRVDRALEKVQAKLSGRGITSTVAALGSALGAAGITAAPATLVGEVAAVALAEGLVLPATTLAAALASSLLPATAVAAVLTGLWTILPQQRANVAMADEIARLERVPAARAGLKAEIADLTRARSQAGPRPAGVVPQPVSARAGLAVPAEAAHVPGASQVLITTQGTLHWDGVPVTLDEFLARLTDYRSDASRKDNRLEVTGNGVRFPQLNYVFDEARKAGIVNLVVESDSEPDPTSPGTFF